MIDVHSPHCLPYPITIIITTVARAVLLPR